MNHEVILSHTESICPECSVRIPAKRIARGSHVILKKTCSVHGTFQSVIWRGRPSYLSWNKRKEPSCPGAPFTKIDSGCPWDCGLCVGHRQHTCIALLEVTQRCNLTCTFCFADASNKRLQDPDIKTVRFWFERLLAAGGPYNIQLSGGEPTLREDLPEIIALGRSLDFRFLQLNTNGLRLGADISYAQKIADAGLTSVFLQFDGVKDEIYEKLRGRPLLKTKRLAIDQCAKNQLGVVLVPTIVPGVNVQEIGAIIDFAIQHVPIVRGIHFQPVSYFGRYPERPTDKDRITIPEIIKEIEIQTAGQIKTEYFKPSGCENAYCSFHGNFVLMQNKELKPWALQNDSECCPKPELVGKMAAKAREFTSHYWSFQKEIDPTRKIGSSLGDWGLFLDRVRTHSLCISGMAFQDVWNLDLNRLQECCIHVVHPDGRLIPFCAYNLNDSQGNSFYRKN